MPDKTLTSFTENDYKIIKQELLYQGVFRFSRYHVRHRKFNGKWSRTYSRELFERPSAAAILPYDPEQDRVILIEQFRIGALSNPQHPWLIEIVAGIYSQNEQAEFVATREATEEAGTDILDIHPIYEYFVSPGGSNEHLKLFIGRVKTKGHEGLFGLDEENEDIRAFSLPINQAFDMLHNGSIKTSPAIITLQWLQIHREWLKKLWQTS